MGTDFSFPLSWRDVPENIYVSIRFVYSAVASAEIRAKQGFLRARGAWTSSRLHLPGTRWISQDMAPHASIPLDYVPAGVVAAGPIVLRSAPAAEQDPDLERWMRRAPTVLVNLGSLFRYNAEHVSAMARALCALLDRVDGLQVLWKLHTEEGDGGSGNDDDDDDTLLRLLPALLSPIRAHIDSGRVRHTDWITADTSALLETGHVAAFVHHGGANSYFEAI